MEDKEHPATPRRQGEFEKKGEIASSRDLTMAAVLIAGFAALAGGISASSAAMLSFSRQIFGGLAGAFNAETGGGAATAFVQATAPVMAACLFAALAAGLMQTRGRILWSSLTFDLTRLNPLPGLRQMLGSTQTMIQLVMSTLKVIAVGSVCVVTIKNEAPALLQGQLWTFGAALMMGSQLITTVALRAFIVMAVIAVLDYGINWFRLQQRMKMSTQELREEMKEDDGDPHIKRRRRTKALEMARARSLKEVPKADVVLVNPTHYAVALAYRPGKMGAPRVVAKGADKLAERIRAAARKHGVPVVSQPPLTRMLFRMVPLGKEVPAELYKAVAVVLSYVYRLRRRAVA